MLLPMGTGVLREPAPCLTGENICGNSGCLSSVRF